MISKRNRVPGFFINPLAVSECGEVVYGTSGQYLILTEVLRVLLGVFMKHNPKTRNAGITIVPCYPRDPV